MTLSFSHDRFAREYLQELLSPLGKVETSQDVNAEDTEIEVFFQPTSVNPESAQTLGLLGKIASGVTIIKPFRNSANTDEIFNFVQKSLHTQLQLLQKSQLEQQSLESAQIPFLWILTPTASESLLKGFGFEIPQKSKDWVKGVYFLSEAWRMGSIVIHQLPKVPETIWLRVLGNGEVQQEAIAELTRLPADNPVRAKVLKLLERAPANLTNNIE
jgi:hypothetical protein